MQNRRDIWILGTLLLVFLLGSVLMNVQQERAEDDKRPSSNVTQAGGTKALFLLFEDQGIKSDRLLAPITKVPDDVGMIVMADPFKRPPTSSEVETMQAWLDKGGTLLYFHSPGVGGTEFTEARTTVGLDKTASLPVNKQSGYADAVKAVQVSGMTHFAILKPKEVTIVLGNSDLPYVITWKEKKGQVVMVADSVGYQNSRIASADNALFFLNIAQKHTSTQKPKVLFDEYHQGFGDEGDDGSKTIWSLIGPTFRMLTWYLVCGLILFIIVGNRRFGSPKELDAPKLRSTTEYIASMAGLYRRARAPHFAVDTLKNEFLKDIARRVDAPVNATNEQICTLSAQQYGWNASKLLGLLQRCDRFMVTAESQRSGNKKTARAMEAEALELGKDLDNYIKTVKAV